MKSKFLILGGLSGIMLSLLAIAMGQVNANDAMCYFLKGNGETVDLTKLCDQKSPDQTAIDHNNNGDANTNVNVSNNDWLSEINTLSPQTPLQGKPIGQKTPSRLWTLLPDQPQPPRSGATVPLSP
jgi:hypothetical protein